LFLCLRHLGIAAPKLRYRGDRGEPIGKHVNLPSSGLGAWYQPRARPNNELVYGIGASQITRQRFLRIDARRYGSGSK
jgi:hypothetical protein